MNFRWFFLHPGVIAGTYLFCGVTSNLTVVVLLVSTVALAAGIYYFWNRWLNRE
jgi:peptidoglycan/LPS O-acetylase OafA/YrhL